MDHDASRPAERASQTPVRRPPGSAAVLEFPFSPEFMKQLAQVGGPLMVWPLTPPIDPAGERDDYRDAPLPYHLWATPQNQQLLLDIDSRVFGYFFANDGLICPANLDLAPLESLERLRVVEPLTHPYEVMPQWQDVVEHLGWAYLPNGPDALWGDLYVGTQNREMVASLQNWSIWYHRQALRRS